MDKIAIGSRASLTRPAWASFGRFSAFRHKHLNRPIKDKKGKRQYIIRDYYEKSEGLV